MIEMFLLFIILSKPPFKAEVQFVTVAPLNVRSSNGESVNINPPLAELLATS